MKTLINTLAVCAALMTAGAAMAESGEGKRGHGDRQPNFERMADRLELSDEQRTEFISVMEAQHAQRVEIMANSGTRESMRALREDTRGQLADILTDEQMTQLEEGARKHRKNGGKRREESDG